MADVIVKVKADVDDKELNSANNSVKRLENSAGSATSAFSGLGKSMLAIGGAIAAAGIAQSILKIGSNMEQARVSFTTFLGSAEKANVVLGDLQQFAKVTPFDNESVIQAGKVLTAFGVETKDLMGTLQSVGDISAGTGKDFNELAVMFGKAKVAGTLYTEDINQLLEAGVPIIEEFAKQLGVAESEVKNMASKGKISFGMLEQGFKNMTAEGSMFGGLMKAQSETIAGKYSTALGELQQVAIKIFDMLAPTMHIVLDLAIKMIGKFGSLVSILRDNSQMLTDLAVVVGIGAAAWGVYTLAVNATAIATNVLAGATALFNAVLAANPIGLAIVALTALAVAIVVAYRKSETFRGILHGVFESLKFIVDYIKNVAVGVFQGFGKVMEGVMSGSLDTVKSGLDAINDTFANADFSKGISDAFNKGFDSQKTKEIALKATAGMGASNAQGATTASGTTMGTMAAGASTAGGKTVNGISGSQPKNITINIENIIREYSVTTNNMRESLGNLRDSVADQIISAVRDAELAIE